MSGDSKRCKLLMSAQVDAWLSKKRSGFLSLVSSVVSPFTLVSSVVSAFTLLLSEVSAFTLVSSVVSVHKAKEAVHFQEAIV